MSQLINEGDQVLLYLDRKRTYLVKIGKEKSFLQAKIYVLDRLQSLGGF